ncbi:cript family protein [Lasiosphaeria ovina]|uniref:Cysteine-rich PDZ-binding protein n=1 Tax=Lasiosphaeria ovina TaxID=92902 RepID=A0AAE0NE51_9PEZI|nr:cript family protein [Lasiosphaeria ovina]
MVCGKCAKLAKTTLATPSVKKKSEMYYGSSASSSASASGDKKTSATLGQSGVSKSKLLSKAAKNPLAQYSSSCGRCKTKISQGYTYCHTCAYRDNSCTMCGKSNSKGKTPAAPFVSGQKFSLK